MTETTLALAEALCRAQEAAQSLSEVAPTTAEHWQGVAVRTHAYLLKSGWRITSAPESADEQQDGGAHRHVSSADDPVSAQAAPEHNHPRESRCLVTECPVGGARAALEGLRPWSDQLGYALARWDREHSDLAIAEVKTAAAIIDARLAALDA